MPLAEITMALAGFRATREVLTAIQEGKIEIATQEKVLNALKAMGDAQETLYALREDLLAQQETSESLRKQLAAFEDWQARTAKFKLVQTQGGAVVYHATEPIEHYACPSCFEVKKLGILQDNRTNVGKYRCTTPNCGAEFPIKVRVNINAIPRRF